MVAPAVPTSRTKSPPLTWRGRKVSAVDPSSAPSTSASATWARAVTAVRCCAWSPGFPAAAKKGAGPKKSAGTGAKGKAKR